MKYVQLFWQNDKDVKTILKLRYLNYDIKP